MDKLRHPEDFLDKNWANSDNFCNEIASWKVMCSRYLRFYSLVIEHIIWKIAILRGKSSINGPFSIAMLLYWRVCLGQNSVPCAAENMAQSCALAIVRFVARVLMAPQCKVKAYSLLSCFIMVYM